MASNYAKISFQGKTLKGKYNASLNGKPFRLNPMSISLDYTVKSSQTPTIGGMVVQVFGVEMGDLTVSGSFGTGGWREQVAFLDRMRSLAQQQASPLGFHEAASPFRFLYPQRNYDFMVYLKQYSSASGMAVDFQNENFAPDWQLTFYIDNDNTGGQLVKVAANAYIERLNAGFGYIPNKYMGNIRASDVENFLAANGFAHNINGYINAAFGQTGDQLLPAPGNSETGSGSGYTNVPSTGSTQSTIWSFFTGKGLSEAATAGIMGNIEEQDTTFNPAIIQGGATAPSNYQMVNGVGFGLVQWTFTSRQAPLQALAESQNLPITDLGLQLNYIWQELNGGYKSNTLEPLKAITGSDTASAGEAAQIVFTNYEGGGSGGAGPAITYAQQILTQFGGNPDGAPAGR